MDLRKAKTPNATPQASVPLPRVVDQGMHVLIAGGDVGGLTPAFSLHQLGIPCTVFEAAMEMKELDRVAIRTRQAALSDPGGLGGQARLLGRM